MADVVAPEKVVSFKYTLRNGEGELLESSGEEAMPYLHGAGNIVPGLERAMQGHAVGDTFDVEVPAAEGYGERIDGTVEVPRSAFPDEVEVSEGMSFVAEGPDGEAFPLWVTGVTDEVVTAEPNHPLAGIDLRFSVEITEIRDASAEELEHGHAHGPDGHHH